MGVKEQGGWGMAEDGGSRGWVLGVTEGRVYNQNPFLRGHFYDLLK